MIGHASKAFFSMLISPRRMHGRSWGTELFARATRRLIEQGQSLPIAKFRHKLEAVKAPDAALKKVKFSQLQMAGVDCLQALPTGIKGAAKRHEKIVVYLHGGGYTVGSPKMYQTFIAQLAVAANAAVIAPDYRLSPEHAFPAAQDDCVAVVEQVRCEHPNAALIVAGDSAGGALAIDVALTLGNNSTEQLIDGALLISPWVDPLASEGTITSNAGNDILSKPFLEESYTGHIQEGDLQNERTQFVNADLGSLPQTYIQVAGGELFLDQVIAFKERAEQQGVKIKMDVFTTQFHVFQCLAPMLKDSKKAVQKAGVFFRIFDQ